MTLRAMLSFLNNIDTKTYKPLVYSLRIADRLSLQLDTKTYKPLVAE